MKIDSKWIIAGLLGVIILIVVFGVGGNKANKDVIKGLEADNKALQEQRDSIASLSVKLQKENKDLYSIIEDRDNKLIDERESRQKQRNAYEKYIKSLRLNTTAELDSAIIELWPEPTGEGLSDTDS
jgi:uncharacterized protein YlxW (UPF0749 family)